ncbi:hypothetical protein BJL95_14715 [Methylomonas sp. LWB]|uniref:alkaline phosphatase D family protein n=1 Tax=Methylomonas sp. LWB TaxID=1905845 RepID=UPI0008D8F339|nr:alkaline phosphatase D family protein [Methylomonas sp. LWB]OHX35492.1 hypothetical protein BJL95_14715 [Methylomonas sp. LWB]
MNDTTIAFASCMDADADPIQNVWDRIRAQKPNVLVLLGDSVYMDFSFGFLGSSKPRGKPYRMSPEDFAEALYACYRKQWQVMSFRRLIGEVSQIAMTWDDHDFAWNNSRGRDQSDCKEAVPKAKRLISRGLFMQFKHCLQTRNSGGSDYPPPPDLAELLAGEDQGIQTVLDVENVRIVTLDGRTFREAPSRLTAWMHGEAQLEWMSQQFEQWQGHKIIASGSTLKLGGESWHDYRDYQWMLARAPQNAIVLTGDIHRNAGPLAHGDPDRFWEVVSSGAARPGAGGFLSIGGGSGRFGILKCGEHAEVRLHETTTEDDSPFRRIY